MDAIGRGRRESVVRTMAALAGLLVGVAGCAEQETPDLNGIWQTPSSAHWNVEPHAAHAGPGTAPDALTAARGGLGIVEGGDIPYQPWARVRQQEHFRDRGALDPLRNCYLPGVPRANYLPYPLQIVQTPTHVLIAYEFAQASRTVYLDRPDFEAPIDGWMGHSLGRWEGDTLVVDVTAQLPDTWLDQAGNFHGAALHVRERYTLEGPNHLRYEATLTDPDVYERPWTLSVLLYREGAPRAQLLDFKCVEFVEERMYGDLTREKPDD